MYGTGTLVSTFFLKYTELNFFITGADLNKDDGIYSAYFMSFNGDGRYAVQVFMTYQDGYSNIICK